MKATLLALVIGLFGVTTVLHANEEAAAPTEPKKEEAPMKKEEHKKGGKMKKGHKHDSKEAAPAPEKQ